MRIEDICVLIRIACDELRKVEMQNVAIVLMETIKGLD